MELEPIGKCIKVVESCPETTLSLETAIERDAESVGTFHFTPSLKKYFEEIFEISSSGRGQGFWIQAEYGAGKTHMIATLAALLTDKKGDLWKRVTDKEIANYKKLFVKKIQFFPVFINCKGKAPTEPGTESLQRVIEEEIQIALKKEGIADKVLVTSSEEILAWWETASSGIKKDISRAIEKMFKGEPTPEELREKKGKEVLANAIQEAAQQLGIEIQRTKDVRSRLRNIYKQITDQGYSGILFIIDEFKSWQELHPEGSKGFNEDEHILETLSFHLPVDDKARIITVIASQAPPPAKLTGGDIGDRFKLFSLFASEYSAREYDVIVAKRIRDIREDKMPELKEYYNYYFKNFKFLGKLKKDYFFDIFPFQPRCFEVIRNITKRELATARSSIHYVHQVLTKESIQKRRGLVKVADLIESDSLVNDLQNPVYKTAYQSYIAALDALGDLSLEDDELRAAKDILKTLFLWHCANLGSPRGMSVSDIVEACLAEDPVLKKEDFVVLILNRLSQLPQVEFTSKEKGAFFRESALEGPIPPTILANYQRKLDDEKDVMPKWRELLIAPIQQTFGIKTIFSGTKVETPEKTKSRANKIRYQGEQVIVSEWKQSWGKRVIDMDRYNLHFRVVYLLSQGEVLEENLEDGRIAVIVPGDWDEVRDVARKYVAITKMESDYQNKEGRDVVEIKKWIENEKRITLGNIVTQQLKYYQSGKVITKSGLGINPAQIFSKPGNFTDDIAAHLLEHSYRQPLFDPDKFRREMTDSEVIKVFNALIKRSSQTSEIHALDNFGLGMGLVSRDKPRDLDPSKCPFFDTIRRELEKEGSDMKLYQFYEKYTGENNGLLEEMVTLYLLAFVRYAQPHCFIHLKPEQNLKLANGKPPQNNRLDESTVQEIEWAKGKLHRAFERLTKAVGPSWNDIVDFARVLDEGLKATTERTEEQTQQERLFKAQESWLEKIQGLRVHIERLAQKLNGDPTPQFELLSQTERICEARDLDAFSRAIKEHFEEDKKKFSKAFEDLKRLDELDRTYGTSLQNAIDYLNEIEGIPEGHSLEKEGEQVLALFNYKSIVEDPATAKKVLVKYKDFKDAYRIAYQKHFREYKKQLEALHQRIVADKSKFEALKRFNDIKDLGKKAQEVLIQSISLDRSTDTKDLPTDIPDLKDKPLVHRITLSTQPPTEEVDNFLKDMDEALIQRLEQLKDPDIVAELKVTGKAKKLVTAIKKEDIKALADAMTPNMVPLLEKVLKKAKIVNVDIHFKDITLPQVVKDEPEEIENVVQAFRDFLEKKLEVARKDHPNKTIRLNLKFED